MLSFSRLSLLVCVLVGLMLLATGIGCDGGSGATDPSDDSVVGAPPDTALEDLSGEVQGDTVGADLFSDTQDDTVDVIEEVVLPDTTPPMVTLITPKDGALVTGVVLVEVEAYDNKGIALVEILIQDELLATLEAEPYQYEWDTGELVPGDYEITAIAYDLSDNPAEDSAMVQVQAECDEDGDCPPKSVKIINPVDGATVCGDFTIEATAQDDKGITEIEFFVDEESLGVDVDSPYQKKWDTTAYEHGDHKLKVIARDTVGHEAFATSTVKVDNGGGSCDNLPSVTIEQPLNEAYVDGEVEIIAKASDDIGVLKVQIFIDNALVAEDDMAPYKVTWDTTEFDEGAHTIKAIAYDTSDQMGQIQIQVTVDRTPPQVEILSPTWDEIYHDLVPIDIEAMDNFVIQYVEVSVDGDEVAVFEETPYSFDYDSSDLWGGEHELEVMAVDGAGHVEWADMWFMIDRPPIVIILAPDNDSEVFGEVEVVAEVDEDVDLGSVVLYLDGAQLGLMDNDWGQHTYTWNTPYAKGTHTLTVVAMDEAGQEGTAEVSMTVDYPVTVSLKDCTSGQCFDFIAEQEVAGILALHAEASDDGEDIANVELHVDGLLEEVDSTEPFDFEWDSTAAEDGIHTITAVAKNTLDETGQVSVVVLVNNCDKDYDGYLALECGGSDCDDLDLNLNPGEPDLVGNGTDENCDGLDGVDWDGDEQASVASGGTDCNDTNLEIFEGQADTVGNGTDDNCDGIDGVDADGDEFASLASGGDDCDDLNTMKNPGMVDTVGNGVDNDCDGIDGVDGDEDGHASVASGGTDCDDTNPDIFSGQVDTVGNDVDDNCDGIDGVDQDDDGHASTESGGDDCDDSDPDIAPSKADAVGNDVDENCDGVDGEDDDGDGYPGNCPPPTVSDSFTDSAQVWMGFDEDNTVESTIEVEAPPDAVVTDVSVTYSFTHTYWGDVEIYLISPSGQLVILRADEGGTNSGFVEESISVSDFADSDAGGPWTLQVGDDAGGDSGVFYGWSISVSFEVSASVTDLSLCDCDDSAPLVFPGQLDSVGDDIDNNCDGIDGVDIDSDGVASILSGGEDCNDTDPNVSPNHSEACNGQDDDCDGAVDEGFSDTDEDNQADCVDDDDDGDGWLDADDNCPVVWNPTQLNTDGDIHGDLCDPDDDNDGVADGEDNCPTIDNFGQDDLDGDGDGDACDSDDDNDGVADGEDNCPTIVNSEQDDLDGDGDGDVCDNDIDEDGYPNSQDCDPYDALINPNAPEECDFIDNNCNGLVDEGYVDTDVDGLKDCVDDDDDNDGIVDELDNCPLVFNPDQFDIDGDGEGDVCGPFDGDTCDTALPLAIAPISAADAGTQVMFTRTTAKMQDDLVSSCNAMLSNTKDQMYTFELAEGMVVKASFDFDGNKWPALSLFTDNCMPGNELACQTATSDAAVIEQPLPPGTYFLVLDAAYNGDFGIYTLSVLFENISTSETDCSDGVDNDLDGLTDCCDDDCAADSTCASETICGDDKDNDCDGVVDCADSDCALDVLCEGKNCASPWLLNGGIAVISGDLPLQLVETGDTSDADADEEGSCDSDTAEARDHVYLLLLGTSASVTISHDFDGYNYPAVYVFEGECTADYELACATASTDAAVIEDLALDAGMYYIVVDASWAGDAGTYTLTVDLAEPITVEDNCNDGEDNDGDGFIDCDDDDCGPEICDPEALPWSEDFSYLLGDDIKCGIWGSSGNCGWEFTADLDLNGFAEFVYAGGCSETEPYWIVGAILDVQACTEISVTFDEAGAYAAWAISHKLGIFDGFALADEIELPLDALTGDWASVGPFTFDVGNLDFIRVGAGYMGDDADTWRIDNFYVECTVAMEICDDNVDNDGDELVDCDDDDCADHIACLGENCAAPIPIAEEPIAQADAPLQVVITGDTTGHTSEYGGTCDSDTDGNADLVYSFELTETMYVSVSHDFDGTYYWSAAYLFSGTCETVNELACDAGNSGASEFGLLLDAGTYYVVVDASYSGDEGPFTLTVDFMEPPPADEIGLCDDDMDNDMDGLTDCEDEDCALDAACAGDFCGNPFILYDTPIGAADAGLQVVMTGDTGDWNNLHGGSCSTGSDSAKDTVYLFELAETMQVTGSHDFEGTYAWSAIYVFAGSCETVNELACEAGGGAAATFDLTLEAGTYYIVVDADYSSDSDAYTLTVDFAVPTPNLYFSEYIEGSAFNKAVEIFNAGNGAIDLEGCAIDRYSNGAAPGDEYKVVISETQETILGAGDVWVVCHNSITDTTNCDFLTSALNYNGDDTLALVCGDTTWDIIGKIGEDPIAGFWGTGNITTKDDTLRRKCSIAEGDTTGDDDFDPAIEWNGAAKDDLTDLGQYICN